jgi:hypothetical protein
MENSNEENTDYEEIHEQFELSVVIPELPEDEENQSPFP